MPAGSTALINVSGTTVTVNGEVRYQSGGTYRQPDDAPVADAVARTIWNFASATSVKLSTGSAFGGTVLAPDAAVEAVSVGHNNGQVIAASFKSNFETHQFPFPGNGCVPSTTPTPPGPTQRRRRDREDRVRRGPEGRRRRHVHAARCATTVPTRRRTSWSPTRCRPA